MICITTEKKKFLYDKNINITYEDYLNGNWKINNQSEKKLWDLVSPRLPNLIKKIVLWKTLEIDSDQYSKIKISVDKLPGFGVDIEQMDYHSLPKIFCLSFRKDKFPFGISKIEISHKSTLSLIIIPPGGFNTISRKANELGIENEFSYGYSLTYEIFEKFNKNNVTCNESLNFVEDNCRLNQVELNIKYHPSLLKAVSVGISHTLFLHINTFSQCQSQHGVRVSTRRTRHCDSDVLILIHLC